MRRSTITIRYPDCDNDKCEGWSQDECWLTEDGRLEVRFLTRSGTPTIVDWKTKEDTDGSWPVYRALATVLESYDGVS